MFQKCTVKLTATYWQPACKLLSLCLDGHRGTQYFFGSIGFLFFSIYSLTFLTPKNGLCPTMGQFCISSCSTIWQRYIILQTKLTYLANLPRSHIMRAKLKIIKHKQEAHQLFPCQTSTAKYEHDVLFTSNPKVKQNPPSQMYCTLTEVLFWAYQSWADLQVRETACAHIYMGGTVV